MTSERHLFIIGALNRRGLKGDEPRVLLHRYSQTRIARQIDYYDYEITSVKGLRLPAWAAAPWLSHRIRRNLPPPKDYKATLPGAFSHLARLARA